MLGHGRDVQLRVGVGINRKDKAAALALTNADALSMGPRLHRDELVVLIWRYGQKSRRRGVWFGHTFDQPLQRPHHGFD